jgi:hypothetical protein
MLPSKETPDLASPQGSEKPAPLFRAEAIEAQQQKFYGEILLIRPLSLALLGWLGIGISVLVLGFLIFGHYTERVAVSGTVVDASGPEHAITADLYVPSRALGSLHAGGTVVVRCTSCIRPNEQTATIEQLSSIPNPEQKSSPTENSIQSPLYKARITFAPTADDSLKSGSSIEAVVSLGRKPLLRWLFPQSSPGAVNERAENSGTKPGASR